MMTSKKRKTDNKDSGPESFNLMWCPPRPLAPLPPSNPKPPPQPRPSILPLLFSIFASQKVCHVSKMWIFSFATDWGENIPCMNDFVLLSSP